MIEVRDLGKTYRTGFFRKSFTALKNATFEVNEGDLFGCIGPNGAGKSTTIKILLGLLKNDSGYARLFGLSPSDYKSRKEVGFLPEHPYFYDYLTGLEILRLYGQLHGLKGDLLKKRISESVERVRARPEWLQRNLRTYSKGMLQRIGLAQALLHKPRLLILDEPMSGLDPMGRRDVRQLLNDLHSEGITIFYSSHVLSDVESICNRVLMLVGGTVRKTGTIEEVMEGESKSFAIKISGKKYPEVVNGLEGVRFENDRFICENEMVKNRFVAKVNEKGLSIDHLEANRTSLEEVLAREVAKENSNIPIGLLG